VVGGGGGGGGDSGDGSCRTLHGMGVGRELGRW